MQGLHTVRRERQRVGRHSSPVIRHSSPITHREMDPTRTTVLRRDYVRAMSLRFGNLKTLIETLILGGFFGGGPEAIVEAAAVELFIARLGQEVESLILEPDTPWQQHFISAAVFKGIRHADRLLKKAGFSLLPESSGGASLYQGLIDRLAAENFDLLRGATDDMVVAVRKSLLEGVGQRLSLDDIAGRINGRVDAIGLNRAKTIARTEIVRAHAEATLDRYETYGIGTASAEVEFTARSDACPICKGLEAQDNGMGPGIYPVAFARGIIPVHPNCRCAWNPVVVSNQMAVNSSQRSVVSSQMVDDSSRIVEAVVAALRGRSAVFNWLLGPSTLRQAQGEQDQGK